MRPRPQVSWLVCADSADERLRGALRSCLAQTFPDIELVFVANGAGAAGIAEAVSGWFPGDARIRILQTPVRHLTFSLSYGLHCAAGDLVARMDADDLSEPDRLERQVAYMREHPEVTVLGSGFRLIDEDGAALQTVACPSTDRAIRRGLLKGNPLCHPTVMFRRIPVLEAGGYLGAVHAQDYDLWARLARDPAVRFAAIPEPLLRYRAPSSGAARRSRSAYAAMAAAQWRNFAEGMGLGWGVASLLSLAKCWLRGRRPRDASS